MAHDRAAAGEVAANRELWTRANREYAGDHAYRAWDAGDITGASSTCPSSNSACSPEPSGPACRELLRPQWETYRLVTGEGGGSSIPATGSGSRSCAPAALPSTT